MGVLWTLLTVLVAGGCLFALGRPLFGPSEPWDTPRQESDLDQLLAEKARTLRALKDIDHDRDAGLLDEGGHAEARSDYLSRAVQLNRRISEITGVDVAGLEAESAS